VSSFLRPLAAGFQLAVTARRAAYRQGWFKTRRLNRPVVSVGNLTTGGSGKTPLVALIAKKLLGRGWKPAILTRGYGRRQSGGIISIQPGVGRLPDPREVGDEPALLAKWLPDVPILVSANRYQAGLQAERRFEVDFHLLDDGFQHLALARDVDVVVLDPTQDYSDGDMLPAGRLREPINSLERADIIVLTRDELADQQPLEIRVRRINPGAQIYRSGTRLCGLRELESGHAMGAEGLVGKPIGAFCGVGNPRAFFGDLVRWGFTVARKFEFPDHHPYSLSDVHRLTTAARKLGALALVTTEKDVMNLPALRASEIPIVACIIETEMRDGEAFVEALVSRLEARRAAN
jgi:tetraacyldisaccharide 4'-kinase